MTPEQVITNVIKLDCSEAHWVAAPFGTPRPYVLMQVYGGRDMRLLNKQPGDKRHMLLQVEVWADTLEEAKAVGRAIENRMCATTEFNARRLDEGQDGGDEELGVRSFLQDFRVYIQRES